MSSPALPWEKYAQQSGEHGPWENYGPSAQQSAPAAAPQAEQTPIDRWRSEDTSDRLSDLGGAWAATKEAGKGALKGAGKSIADIGEMAAEGAGYVNPGLMAPGRMASEKIENTKTRYLTPTNTEQKVGYYGEGAAELALPMMKGAEFLPSIERAGHGFEAVKGAVGHLPIDVADAGDAALRAKELADNGGKMPTLLNKFVRRATDPALPPVNFNDARDFYSNAGNQSVLQKLTTSPTMKRQIALFRKGLSGSIENVADAGGVGEQYRNALSEYRNAMRLRTAAKAAAIIGAAKAAKDLFGYPAVSAARQVLGLP